jgi:hypothetical protein
MREPIRLTDQEGRVLSMDAFQRRTMDEYLAREARLEWNQTLKGCRNGLAISALLAVAAGVVFRRWWS